jgi:tetratricopeptide (TPR) repeat protein
MDISKNFLFDKSYLFSQEKKQLTKEEWDLEMFPPYTTTTNTKLLQVDFEIVETIQESFQCKFQVLTNFKPFVPYDQVEVRIQSKFLQSMKVALFKKCGILPTKEEESDTSGKLFDDLPGPPDASFVDDPYHRPKLTETEADALLTEISRAAKERNVPVIAWIVMAQHCLLRLKSNRKQYIRLRKDLIQFCQRDFDEYAEQTKSSNLRGLLDMYAHALMIRLGNDEPAWGIFHGVVLFGVDYIEHDRIQDIFHFLWYLELAIGLRPKEERFDPVVVLQYYEEAVVDCAKIGMYLFCKKEQWKLISSSVVGDSAQQPSSNQPHPSFSTTTSLAASSATVLPSPKKNKKVDLARTTSAERTHINNVELIRSSSADRANLHSAVGVGEKSSSYISLPTDWQMKDIVELNVSRPELALVCTVCWCRFTTQDPPVTFGDGKSVCRSCVSKKRSRLAQLEKMQEMSKVSNYDMDQIPKPLSEIFGGSYDVTLGRVVQFVEENASTVSETEKEAVRLRRLGNALYRRGKYKEALDVYTDAINMSASAAVVFSNRSACLVKLGRKQEAATDALKALHLTEGRWGKAYYRLYAALPHVTSSRGSKTRGLLKVIPNEDDSGIEKNEDEKEISEEDFLRYWRNRRPLAEESEVQSWLKLRPDVAVRTLANITRAFVLGEQVEHQFRKACRSFLLADCSRFDQILEQAKGDVERIKSRLSDLRKSSLVLMFARELIQSLDLEQVLETKEINGTNIDMIKEQNSIRRESLQNFGELDCTLCYSLLCEPTTLPCGHSFCKSCAIRAMDHSSAQQGEASCPMCRFPLGPYLDSLNDMAFQTTERLDVLDIGLQHVELNRALDGFIRFVFPEEYNSRLESTQLEEAPVLQSGTSDPMETDIPIIPYDSPLMSTMENSLILWEPSERLMIRRLALVNSKKQEEQRGTNAADISGIGPGEVGHMTATRRAIGRFGVCWSIDPAKTGFGAKYGVLQQIDNLSGTSDGGLIVTCTGKQRFEILREGSRDGYKTARVRLLEIDIHKYHIPEDEIERWTKANYPDRSELAYALVEAITNRYKEAPNELLMVALEMYLSVVKAKHPRYLEVCEHELCCMSSAPYYIATILSFPHQLQYYLMFGPETVNSYWNRIKFILLLGPLGGESFPPASLDSVHTFSDVFPGLATWPIGEASDEEEEDDEDDEDEDDEDSEDEDDGNDDVAEEIDRDLINNVAHGIQNLYSGRF